MARHLVCQIVAALGLVSWVNGVNGGFPSGLKRNRILDGVELAPHSLPWQVYLDNGGLYCGATILSEKFILTAGHCCEDPKCKGTNAIVGVHNPSNDEPTQTKHTVKEEHIHPKYGSVDRHPEYDFALLELSEPIKFRDVAKAISLPSPQDTEEGGAFNEDTVFVTSGWGMTLPPYRGQMGSGKQNSDVLITTSVPWLSDEACQKAFDESPIGLEQGLVWKITEDMICAGTTERGTCYGDSGGPLAWLDHKTMVVKLIGAVSGGWFCKTHQVYAELTTVLDWIRGIIGDSNEEACSKGNCMTWDDLNEDARLAFQVKMYQSQ